ncbi:hypothetical protein [Moellerella wisconsensis]|uniref:Uncharacterized protein n=1 Tax=Moellerella wisconsensis TaxID=158849 RepID=A0ACD3Y440_9GAMM|nr:hypothetical protein [Moellerella wisconsensis]UNH37800.1 hypothetical protein MNY70_09735 [Moellerella wisconsensis]
MTELEIEDLNILIASEQQRIQQWKSLSHLPVSEQQKQSTIGLKKPSLLTRPFDAAKIPDFALKCPVDGALFHKIAKHAVIFEPIEVTEKNIECARTYVGNKLGYDLISDIEIVRIPHHLWDLGQSSEAFVIPGGYKNHHIFMPSHFASPEELLCHEIAHTAHYTAQRMNGEYFSFFPRSLTAEMVAHYVQFNFIKDNLNIQYFNSAILQLVEASYAHLIYQYAITKNNGHFPSYSEFIHSEIARPIKDNWDLDILERTFHELTNDTERITERFHRSIALILALILIKEHEGFRKLIYLDNGEIPFIDLLTSSFPSVDFVSKWENASESIISLFSH